ncbi:MAG: ABC transporter ATP-binding protein [Paracoccaceae bacterium]
MDEVLRAVGLSKSFGALRVSRDVSLTLRSGEIHALIGPNGAGKSTLIAQLAGGLRPDAGRVELLGRDVTGLGTAARARLGLARTFQISALALGATTLENAMLGALASRGRALRLGPRRREGDAREAARAALADVGLADDAHVPAGELSHGGRRRLEVAIALTLRPVAMILDEPMAGMGAEGARDLTRLLDRLRHTAPILLVEHDMDAVFALADRVSVLVDGAILATGPAAAIRADPIVRNAYLGDAA